MALALFDLDNTLIAGDSDHLWGRFLVAQGLVDGPEFERMNDAFYRDYRAGRLDIRAFLRFALRPLARHPRAELEAWRERFVREEIEPIVLPAARALLARHRAAGDTLLIVTATNSFVTAPIAERLGVEHLLATEPETEGDRFTGEVAGVPCFREGKVQRLREWMQRHGEDLAGSWFYSDSRNDLPLLEEVEHPVATDPDPELEAVARQRAWPVITLRAGPTPQEL